MMKERKHGARCLRFRDSPREGRGEAQESPPGGENLPEGRWSKAACAIRVKSSLVQKRGC